MEHDNQGEGNREADRRYREGVQKTVRETTNEERANAARDLDGDDREDARAAEEAGKARKRSSSDEREI
jgi:hypothetical protein